MKEQSRNIENTHTRTHTHPHTRVEQEGVKQTQAKVSIDKKNTVNYQIRNTSAFAKQTIRLK